MEKDYMKFATKIAYKAGAIMRKNFNNKVEKSYKEDNTIVTKADKEINDYLIACVKKDYKTHSVDGEEKTFGKSKYVWVCDPIDGTAMFARGVPVAVFSLALVVDGEPVLGVVYDPWNDNLYSAEKGKGAYKNGKKISVSDIEIGDKRSLGNYDMWNTSEYNIFPVIEKLYEKSSIYSIGSVVRACMCVAEGEFGFAIFPGTDHKNCDIAASKIIVEEAGGKVTDIFGNEQRYDQSINGAIVSNKVNYENLLGYIKKYTKNK